MIAARKEQRIRRLLARSDKSPRAIARDVGVSRDAVLRVLRQVAGLGPKTRAAEIAFRRVEAYYCRGCQAEVRYLPCPGCHARFARIGRRA
jgi:hypothetical protein